MSETKAPKAKPAAKPKKAEHAHNDAQAASAPEGASSIVIIKGKPLSTRGRTFTGTIVSDRMSKTVTVEWERRRYVPKYQRYEKRRTRVKAHDELGVKMGDIVEIVETRPISKTKNFLVMRVIKPADQK
nr:30S ribosomal protein S17P [uncultured archaeon]